MGNRYLKYANVNDTNNPIEKEIILKSIQKIERKQKKRGKEEIRKELKGPWMSYTFDYMKKLYGVA